MAQYTATNSRLAPVAMGQGTSLCSSLLNNAYGLAKFASYHGVRLTFQGVVVVPLHGVALIMNTAKAFARSSGRQEYCARLAESYALLTDMLMDRVPSACTPATNGDLSAHEATTPQSDTDVGTPNNTRQQVPAAVQQAVPVTEVVDYDADGLVEQQVSRLPLATLEVSVVGILS